MSDDLIMKNIFLNKKVGSQKTQILLEGDIIVPDVKPDMASILQTQSDIFIEKTNVLQDKINFMGKLNIQILYLAKSNENKICSINHVSQIDDFINIDNINPQMFCDLKANINKIDYKMLNDRKINFKAVINITAEVQEEYQKEIISGIKNVSESQLLKKKYLVNKLMDMRFDRFVIKDEINLISSKPNINEILETDINIVQKDIKISEGKVNVSGELVLKILYLPHENYDFPIEVFEHEINFNGAFDVPKAKDFMFCDVDLFVQDKYIQAKANQDGENRLIDIEIYVGANIKLNTQDEFEILEDAYLINKKLDIKYEEINFQNMVCKNKMQTQIKEIIQLEKKCPDILQILKINACPKIDDSHIINDNLIVEGIICVNVFYLTKDENALLNSFDTILPFKQTIEMRGALPDMETDMNIKLGYLNFNLLSHNEIELKILLDINASIEEEEKLKVITNINFDDMDKEILENSPSMIVYIAQKNDTLWQIAKRYNVEIDDLKQVNDLENEINPGQKLLIVKNVCIK